MAQNLASKTASGVKWSTASTMFNAILQVGYTAIMARLLDPEEFGLVAMMHVVLRFVDYFAKMGMAHAVIQKKELSKEDIRAAFTTSLFLGVVSMILVLLLAPLAVNIFDSDRLINVIRFASLSFFIQGISTTSVSLLSRELNFKAMAINNITSYVIGYVIIGITMAYSGYGVYSLISAMLSQVLINGIMCYLVTKHSIKPIFQWKHFKPLFSYGSKISIISFFEFIMGSMDKLLIGRMLGSGMLGFYDRAFQLIYLPVYYISMSISRVMFSSFSKLQSDMKELFRSYSSTITLAGLLVFPVCFGVSAASNEVVRIVLGEGWDKSIEILRVLSFAVPLAMMNTFFSGIVCEATANLNKKLYITLFQIVVLATGFYYFSRYGLIGFAGVFVVSEILRTILYFIALGDIMKVSVFAIFKSYLPGLVNGVIIGSGIFLVSYLSDSYQIILPITFALELITGAMLMAILILIFPHPIVLIRIHRFIGKFENMDQSKFYFRYYKLYASRINKMMLAHKG